MDSVGHGSVPRRPLFPDQVELYWGGTANNGLPVSFYFSKGKPGKKNFNIDIYSPLIKFSIKNFADFVRFAGFVDFVDLFYFVHFLDMGNT